MLKNVLVGMLIALFIIVGHGEFASAQESSGQKSKAKEVIDNTVQKVKDVANKVTNETHKMQVVCHSAWTTPVMIKSGNATVYMNIANKTSRDLVLLKAAAPTISKHVELYKTVLDEQGVVQSVPIEKVIIPAHSEIILTPEGLHLVIFHLNTALNLDEMFTVELSFEGLDAIKVPVTVKLGK